MIRQPRSFAAKLAAVAASRSTSRKALANRLAFVAQRSHLRRFGEQQGQPLERLIERLEAQERGARRRRPCVRLTRDGLGRPDARPAKAYRTYRGDAADQARQGPVRPPR